MNPEIERKKIELRKKIACCGPPDESLEKSPYIITSFFPTKYRNLYIEEKPELIKYIKKKYRSTCLAAVRSDPMSLEYIDFYSQTEEICLEAVKGNPLAIQFAKKQDLEMCKVALEKDPSTFVYFDEEYRTPEICYIALKMDARNFAHMNITEEKDIIIAIGINKDVFDIIPKESMTKNIIEAYMNVLRKEME